MDNRIIHTYNEQENVKNLVVKEQFNRQAEKYAKWKMGKNVKNLEGYFNYCKIQPHDNVLDVACGTGEFIVHASPMIASGCGVDISDKEIELANNLVADLQLSNTRFVCSDVEQLPFDDNNFSVVICRYAFHHFTNPGTVFNEMIRCCEQGGKIGILDIASYKDEYVNSFFEKFDNLVDLSHNKTLNTGEFNRLYERGNMEKMNEMVIDVELDVQEYMEHAYQDQASKAMIEDMLLDGLEDKRLNKFLFIKNGALHFKRHVYLALGKKN